MKRSCIVVPVHPPKFHHFVGLVESYVRHFDDDDLFAVFSSEDERDLFVDAYPDLRFRPLVVSWSHTGSERSGIITGKKLIGVQQVFEMGYEYAAAVDAECLVIAGHDYDHLFRRWFEAKRLYGNRTTCDAARFLRDPLRFYDDASRKVIRSHTRDSTLYCWFNDMPVYERRSFEAFIARLPLEQVTWFDFDHILYQYHLIAHEGFTIEPIMVDDDVVHAPFGFLEDQRWAQMMISSANIDRIFNQIRPMWATQNNGRLNPEVFMLFHRDRS